MKVKEGSARIDKIVRNKLYLLITALFLASQASKGRTAKWVVQIFIF